MNNINIDNKEKLDYSVRNRFLFDISNNKYKDWLNTGGGIFFNNKEKDIPDTLIECEKLFDKNVLEIKKLVNNVERIK